MEVSGKQRPAPGDGADHTRVKQGVVSKNEPRMNTNRHEYGWTSFNHSRPGNAPAVLPLGATLSWDEAHLGARASRPHKSWQSLGQLLHPRRPAPAPGRCFGRARGVPAGRVAGCRIAGKPSGTQRDSMRAGRPRSRVGIPFGRRVGPPPDRLRAAPLSLRLPLKGGVILKFLMKAITPPLRGSRRSRAEWRRLMRRGADAASRDSAARRRAGGSRRHLPGITTPPGNKSRVLTKFAKGFSCCRQARLRKSSRSARTGSCPPSRSSSAPGLRLPAEPCRRRRWPATRWCGFPGWRLPNGR